MTRKPFLYIFLIALALNACAFNYQNATTETLLPNAKYARDNAKEGLIFLREGNTPFAYEKLQLAYQQNPKDPLVIQSLGYYYEKTGEIDKANQYYTYSLTVAPDSSEALENYAVFLCRNGYYELSGDYFKIAETLQKLPNTRETKSKAQYCHQKMQRALGDKATWAYYMAK